MITIIIIAAGLFATIGFVIFFDRALDALFDWEVRREEERRVRNSFSVRNGYQSYEQARAKINGMDSEDDAVRVAYSVLGMKK